MDDADRWNVKSIGCQRQDKTIFNRMMLRFRPIAPKPATSGSNSLPENKNNTFVAKSRKKRKYVRLRTDNNGYKKKKMVPVEESKDGLNKKILTLQLLPEKDLDTGGTGSKVTLQLLPEGAEKKDLDTGDTGSKVDPTAGKLAADDNEDGDPRMGLKDKKWVFASVNPDAESDRTVVTAPMRVVESWVTVASVTDTCMDVRWLGCTDGEIIKNLERDTCPGFISDGLDRVRWVNEAYKRMVSEEGNGQVPECTVRLVAKEKFEFPYLHPGFTGHVRLQHTWRNQKCSKVMPCDVWRMEFGGFAWRLDVKAALSLGL
ncbi:hypothetical protein F2P56_000564 [Juglans regia]|uniref:Uncharacterized protein LOC108984044 n=2 Tax=Juglans regia TaxID=51240 RepID=A0A2I4DW89_JUGRE|nr:uncharacterized protein LOC108984044 [Juglans regia]XP_018811417.1 uncharacterized protein LOC108984044 [Juglans regia]XP_018811418.1 uncharacterized protein LOC108984044 [Juglans regia]XP_035549856.1 uncharacterized protein LOC108984044 [Juglans regia]KAF5479773.1 hypothetical protein F2P56_000564 [Juglans regia]